MHLLYDKNDLPTARKLHDERLEWLQELGAAELADVGTEDSGFLFGYTQGGDHLRQQVGKLPNVHDRLEERDELLRLDAVLERMEQDGTVVPTPKTWILQIDDPPPCDLEFPLFVRTPTTSWKRGGEQAKVKNLKELNDEVELLRRAFGWDTPVLLRQWLDLAVAGEWMFGKAPQEVRTWAVEGTPVAWSFHYLHAVLEPKGFPPSSDELKLIADMAKKVADPFKSRLIAVDFARGKNGEWHFMEAGPGAVSGTAHEAVFKFVAMRLTSEQIELVGDDVGGPL